jgi:hypothetical protein
MPFSPFTLSTTISSDTNWVYLGGLKCNMHLHLDPHTPNQCLSYPTYYPPILIFPIPMHKCKELSSFSLCVFPLLLRHDLEWDLLTHVRSSVGRFSLFCENWPVPILSWCYKNLIGSLIIYKKLGWGETVRLSFYFFKLTWFSDKSVLIYTTTTRSQISRFSYIQQHPDY